MSTAAVKRRATPADGLDDRIAAAFQDGADSGTVSELINETKAAVIASAETAERCRERALDPTLAPSDVAAARRTMEDAAFRRDRLAVAVHRLADRLEQLRKQEEDCRRQAAYDKVKAERDALAEELARVYPPLAAQLSELLARIAANDRMIEYVNNNARPSRSGRLLVAELVARGLEGFVQNSVETPSIVRSVRLPTFERSPHQPFAWPRHR